MRLCDLLNQRWDEAKPWILAKDPAKATELQAVCSECLLGFYVVAAYLHPILPSLGTRALALFGERPGQLESMVGSLPRRVLPYEPLLTRIDPSADCGHDRSFEGGPQAGHAGPPWPSGAAKLAVPANAGAVAGLVGIEDFAKLDLASRHGARVRLRRGLRQAAALQARCR